MNIGEYCPSQCIILRSYARAIWYTARDNIHQFSCNDPISVQWKPYCTLVPRNFIHWFCTRVQYDFLLHRNCFLLINMLENGMSRVLLLVYFWNQTRNKNICKLNKGNALKDLFSQFVSSKIFLAIVI
jgi:hypothetical protein